MLHSIKIMYQNSLIILEDYFYKMNKVTYIHSEDFGPRIKMNATQWLSFFQCLFQVNKGYRDVSIGVLSGV